MARCGLGVGARVRRSTRAIRLRAAACPTGRTGTRRRRMRATGRAPRGGPGWLRARHRRPAATTRPRPARRRGGERHRSPRARRASGRASSAPRRVALQRPREKSPRARFPDYRSVRRSVPRAMRTRPGRRARGRSGRAGARAARSPVRRCAGMRYWPRCRRSPHFLSFPLSPLSPGQSPFLSAVIAPVVSMKRSAGSAQRGVPLPIVAQRSRASRIPACRRRLAKPHEPQDHRCTCPAGTAPRVLCGRACAVSALIEPGTPLALA